MRIALEEAKRAYEEEEVPVGAVLISKDGKIIARGRNQIIKLCDPTAHAEILVLRKASRKLGNYRLLGTRLYVTLEPCPMCVYAMVLARIEELIFGAEDPKTGGCGGKINLLEKGLFNHIFKITKGVLREECGEILRKFFRERR